ncbi:TetR/AcrR family transcriptional regulator [Rhodococcus sp. NPDC078407]|uniref:TetR/AcrR family transcriptional regulator n=1 Tax=Rhodococcus sp. NPDC078407 TaxID=3364509 RepID=UPI0037CB4163
MTREQLPGRRSARSHRAVLESALALVREQGYAAVTIDGIASRAGVSKATIYRWWNHKSAILVEAFLTSVHPQIMFPDSGSAREDLVAQATSLARVLSDPVLGSLFVSLLGEARYDPDLATALRDGWQTPRRAAGVEVIERAMARNELPADTDPELVLDGVYGPLYLRLLFGHAPLDEPSLRQIVAQVFDGTGVGRG